MTKLYGLLISLIEENRLYRSGDQFALAMAGCIPYQAPESKGMKQLFKNQVRENLLLLSGLNIESNRTWSFAASLSCPECILQSS